MNRPQETQTDEASDLHPTVRPIIDSFLQRMTVDQRERLREGSPDMPTQQLMMDLLMEIIEGLSADLLKSMRRLKVEMTEEGVKASLGDTVTRALKEAINGQNCSCQCRSARRLNDLVSVAVHQSLQSSSFGGDAQAKPGSPLSRLRKMLQLAINTCACIPRKVKDLFIFGSGTRPSPHVRSTDPDFEPQDPQNHEGPIDIPEPEPCERPKGTSGDSPHISAHELPGMVPPDPDPEELNPPDVGPSVVVKKKMSLSVKKKTLEFLIRTLVSKTLQKFKVDGVCDADVYVAPLLQRALAELEDLDFNLDHINLRQFNTGIFRDLCEKWRGDFNLLIALKRNDPELADWVASTLRDRLMAPPVMSSSFLRWILPAGE
ncbi:uncharacterized protein ACO6RY_09398 [Pungitius sinensis]